MIVMMTSRAELCFIPGGQDKCMWRGVMWYRRKTYLSLSSNGVIEYVHSLIADTRNYVGL